MGRSSERPTLWRSGEDPIAGYFLALPQREFRTSVVSNRTGRQVNKTLSAWDRRTLADPPIPSHIPTLSRSNLHLMEE
jgi:hypothetical protein